MECEIYTIFHEPRIDLNECKNSLIKWKIDWMIKEVQRRMQPFRSQKWENVINHIHPVPDERV